ncbi:vacuolar protein sorting-associated protein 13B [Aphidius gifuensis]|uniref:vacuolar protein sorting-associated protein 13B n=1 Tax=Aphidius gifuensis TaxID=684658 RepID=UPI001CDD43D4|nr:vacuolar protein sorting-associated protein 13B [Aphidius gifuensis]
MFKLESYITPVLLNYVGKYVKNFKPEQSQVSLWGGDATFQNLDLRLNVLNEQFNFPFTFVSGHIHELLIHVPWVKITSEPIVITINTIECILKMKDGTEKNDDTQNTQKSNESLQENAPPGYIKSIVTKVVNNITINCNNLILKFVEEDIVLSVNIRFLSMQTVNDKWKPTFTDVSGNEMILRRVVTIEDLTLCLDKMDSSGKIDIYQDPVVYRCSMTIRLLMNYLNSQSKRATIIRFDMHCEKMDFSMTEQQIPMLLRLITIMMSRKNKKLLSINEKRSSLNDVIIDVDDDSSVNNKNHDISDDNTNVNNNVDIDDDTLSIASMNNENNSSLGWSTWAWNTMTYVLPVDWNDDWSIDNDTNDNIVHTFHFGIYIKNAILTFKIIENTKEKYKNKTMKIKYRQFLTLKLNGVVLTAIQQMITTTAYQFGISSIILLPRGCCNCGFNEVKSIEKIPINYLTCGNDNTDDNSLSTYLNDSLFDDNSLENNDKIKDYKDEITQRLTTNIIIKKMLDNCPALSFDFIHIIELPDNLTDNELFKLGTNFENSNFKENEIIKYFIGNLNINICSGMIHRLNKIKCSIKKSDFLNSLPTKMIPKIDELPPVTVEEFTSLSDYVPITKTHININKFIIKLQLADHRIDAKKIKNIEKNISLNTKLLNYPKLYLEFDEIIGTITLPMYGYRLVACASKQNILPPKMLEQCYKKTTIKFKGLNSRLYLDTNKQTSIIMPTNIDCNINTLLYPQYWINNYNIIKQDENIKINCLTLTTTKSKLIIIHSIIMSIFYSNYYIDNPLICSSLFDDASNEFNPVYLELLIENINYSSIKTFKKNHKKFNISSIKIFAIDNNSQAVILSGPETNNTIDTNDNLLTAELKLPINNNADDIDNNDLIILLFKISQTRISIDPLLINWLSYNYNYYEMDIKNTNRHEYRDENSSDTSTKKTFPSLHENVHSPSEKDKKWHWKVDSNSKKNLHNTTLDDDDYDDDHNNNDEIDNGIFKRIKNSYFLWNKIVLNINIEPFVIYIPTKTMNGLDMNGIENSKNRALNNDNSLELIVIKTSNLTIISSNYTDYIDEEKKINNFPWDLNLTEFHCYTITNNIKLNLIKIESLKATIDAIIKTTNEKNLINNTLGICIYIDTSPIIISLSKKQLKLMKKIIIKILKIIEINCTSQKVPIIINNNINSNNTNNNNSNVVENVKAFTSQQSQSPHIFCTEETDTTSTASTSKQDSNKLMKKDDNNVTMTAWIQWTITKIALKLYSNDKVDNKIERKTIIIFEDIITSLDWQPIYIQLKNKITTAIGLHYKKYNNDKNSEWKIGEYSGLIMCLTDTDDYSSNEDFINITATTARSNEVYTKWNFDRQNCKFIKEIFDPLIYFHSEGIKFVFPTKINIDNDLQHDTIVFEITDMTINPHPRNPICRKIYRTDIYESAAQANLLNRPGSAVEDRQYNISLSSVSCKAQNWKIHEDQLKENFKKSSLSKINENPALEWNTMRNLHYSYNKPTFFFSNIDIKIIIAPPIIYKFDTIICGSAIELTCPHDIEISIVLDEVKLILKFIKQFIELKNDYINENINTTIIDNDISNFYSSVLNVNTLNDTSQDSTREYGQDSGVDVEISSTDIAFNIQKNYKNTITSLPCEYFLNFGKITIDIYSLSTIENNGYDINIKFLPLMCMIIDQPHVYILEKKYTKIVKINCFDYSIAFTKNITACYLSERIDVIYDYYIIETKNGDSNPSTGIPSSFIVVEYEKNQKNNSINIDMGRPIKFNSSLLLLERIDIVKEKIINCFDWKNELSNDNDDLTDKSLETNNENRIKKFMINLPNLNITTKQIVYEFKTDLSSGAMISIAGLSIALSSKSRIVVANFNIKSAMITTFIDTNRAFLKPLTMNIVTSIIWEPWQDTNNIPKIRIQAYSDDIRFDIGPEHIKVLQNIQNNIKKITDKYFSNYINEQIDDDKKNTITITEQHYQDDLKVGAFQFIEGNHDELPNPYQVVYSTDINNQTISWRYPQPRHLTRLHVTPLFFESNCDTVDDNDEDIDNDDDDDSNRNNNEDDDDEDEDEDYYKNIHCVIEYWSDCLMSYQRYIELNLSDTEKSTFQLRNKSPTRAVACVWRLVLYSSSKIDTKKLAACLRIDSYFNSSLIPNIDITFSLKSIELSFYNHIDINIYKNLPKPIDYYKLNCLPPSTQCFSIININNVIIVYNKWNNSMLMDFNGCLNIKILDHATLLMQNLINKFDFKFQISTIKNSINISMMCNDLWILFGPEISHTLTSSFSIWSSSLNSQQNDDNNIVIFTRYVIANDTNIPIVFSQNKSSDNILIRNRECNFYSWYNSNNNKTLRICIKHEKNIVNQQDTMPSQKNNNIEAIWSSEFNIDNDETKLIKFNKEINFILYVNIKSLSTTQKLITFTGQLLIFNKLNTDIKLKLIKYQTTELDTNKKILNEEIFLIKNNNKSSSIIIDKKNINYTMRCIFDNSIGSQWTGDIPLNSNKKCDQPWLVKVPIKSHDKYLSIWVRIIRENNEFGRIIVIFSPLYMIKSYLPKKCNIKITTPTLSSSSFDIDISGCGELQQLNCPGTFENYHQLTFNNEENISTFENSIPLSYGSIDQRSYFKINDSNIDKIIDSLELNDSQNLTWPFDDEYDDNIINYKPVEELNTHVLIKYRDAGFLSSTLLIEIRPWCFILNTTGCQISILINDNNICNIPHNHVASPPKLDGIFNIEIMIDNIKYKSSSLQLANSEWNRGFIMPQISGLIPIEGTIKILINCDKSFCYLIITSCIINDTRIIKITSSHIICNFTDNIFNISNISTSKTSNFITLPNDLSDYSEEILINKTKNKGKPITKWYSFDKDNTLDNELLFISLSTGNGWSCPVKVCQIISRTCIAVPNGNTTIPIVITTQKDKDITYIIISKDIHPQMIIKNLCLFDLNIGTPNLNNNNIIQYDSPPFTWICCVKSKNTCHYTTVNFGSRIPDASIAPEPKTILLLTSIEKNWHKIIVISDEKPINFDQFIQVDSATDLKINVKSHGHTVHIIIEPKSIVEISAKHIRERLTSEGSIDNRNVRDSGDSNGESTICNCPSLSSSLNDDDTTNNTPIEIDKFFTFYFHGINFIITNDADKNGQRQEIASLYLSKTVVSLTSIDKFLNIALMTDDLQLDNQMFDKGGYDFPVVFISQKPKSKTTIITNKLFPFSLDNIINELKKNSLITFEFFWEKINGKNAFKSVNVCFSPINIYIEDKYVTQLLEYATSCVSPCLIILKNNNINLINNIDLLMTTVPESIIIDSIIISNPLQLTNLTIEPISILLSVHTSVRLYVALDHSPLHFGIFERQNLFTTPYKLGNALTMHYLFGAIFGAGWVVGSLEILGSPGSFAQALGSGLKDFVALPFQGLLQGPWGFIVGITHGSASLMKNITAGTVNSLTKLASSVARNLDRLTLDEEHLQRQEESRRIRPQGMTQGLYQGLTGFGISILAAVAGIAHHPLQNFLSGQVSTSGLVTGIGVGLVGVVTKPLSGAAELVALTGQGLLHRTGWNSLPTPKRQSSIFNNNNYQNNHMIISTRYYWKLEPILSKKSDKILHTCCGKFIDDKGNIFIVTILLTRKDLIVINIEEDKIYKTFVIRELDIDNDDHNDNDDNLLKLSYSLINKQRDCPRAPSERYEMTVETRNRIEQYVINSTGLVNIDNNNHNHSIQGVSTVNCKNYLTFYLDPWEKLHLISLMSIIKKQGQGTNFTIL